MFGHLMGTVVYDIDGNVSCRRIRRNINIVIDPTVVAAVAGRTAYCVVNPLAAAIIPTTTGHPNRAVIAAFVSYSVVVTDVNRRFRTRVVVDDIDVTVGTASGFVTGIRSQSYPDLFGSLMGTVVYDTDGNVCRTRTCRNINIAIEAAVVAAIGRRTADAVVNSLAAAVITTSTGHFDITAIATFASYSVVVADVNRRFVVVDIDITVSAASRVVSRTRSQSYPDLFRCFSDPVIHGTDRYVCCCLTCGNINIAVDPAVVAAVARRTAYCVVNSLAAAVVPTATGHPNRATITTFVSYSVVVADINRRFPVVIDDIDITASATSRLISRTRPQSYPDLFGSLIATVVYDTDGNVCRTRTCRNINIAIEAAVVAAIGRRTADAVVNSLAAAVITTSTGHFDITAIAIFASCIVVVADVNRRFVVVDIDVTAGAASRVVSRTRPQIYPNLFRCFSDPVIHGTDRYVSVTRTCRDSYRAVERTVVAAVGSSTAQGIVNRFCTAVVPTATGHPNRPIIAAFASVGVVVADVNRRFRTRIVVVDPDRTGFTAADVVIAISPKRYRYVFGIFKAGVIGDINRNIDARFTCRYNDGTREAAVVTAVARRTAYCVVNPFAATVVSTATANCEFARVLALVPLALASIPV